MNTESQPEPSWFSKLRTGEPLQIMQVGTIIWLIFLVLFVLTTKQCTFKWDVAWYRPDLRYFSCRTSNELGDFLAGAFAPLAFLWLAGAVFIQSRELKDQKEVLSLTRQELELTRKEMGEQRKVMEAQAKEAKASAKFLGKQTEILSKQQARADQEAADDEFEEILKIVFESASACSWVGIASAKKPNSLIKHVICLPGGESVEEVMKALASMGTRLDIILNHVKAEGSHNFCLFFDGSLVYLGRIYSSLLQLKRALSGLSSEGYRKYVRLGCGDALENVQRIIDELASDKQVQEIMKAVIELEKELANLTTQQ